MEATAKPRISDRTSHENYLLQWRSVIANATVKAENAERAGNFREAREHRDVVEGMTKYMETSIAQEAKHANDKKEKPLPVNYVPAHIPDAELDSTQILIRNLENHAEEWRKRADRYGVEGEYSEDVTMMHAVQSARDTTVRREMRDKSPFPVFTSADASSFAWGLLAFAVILPFLIAFLSA